MTPALSIKQAIYIGPSDSRPHTLSYGMTGHYDSEYSMFVPDCDSDDELRAYPAVPLDNFKITEA